MTVRLLLAALGLLAGQAVPVAAEQLFSSYIDVEEPPAAYLTISPCTGEEASECLSHSLTCDPASWPSVRFNVVYGPVEAIATALVTGTDGDAYGEARLGGGGTVAELRVSSVHVDANEMDGGWMLALGIADAMPLLDALTRETSEGASLVFAGEAFALAPQPGDGAKLLAWKDSCLRLLGY